MKRGDAVLVPVPDTSGSAGKVRPALIVSSDTNNQRLLDVIVAVITKTTKRVSVEPTQLLVELVTLKASYPDYCDRFSNQVRTAPCNSAELRSSHYRISPRHHHAESE